MTNTKAQAGVQAAPAPWPTLGVAELAAHPGNRRDIEAPADLLADVKENGVEEPLYVVRTNGNVPQVIDGFQRLAAAVAAGLETVPVTPRPVIRIGALTPHPKNAREDLDINAPFVDSLRAEGCRIPVKVQRLDGGVLQVNDGNRRFFGSKDAGLTHLPYEWDDDDRDAAGQFLDMITTAQHRKGLSPSEMNVAMFAASEAGAQIGRIAKAAGVRQKDVRTLVKVRSDAALNAAVTGGSYEWTFEHMTALTEFADDPEALAAITEVAAKARATPRDVEWIITVERTKRDQQVKAETHRAELEADGQRIREAEELSERALPVWRLREISMEEHAQCKGQVWVFDEQRGDRYEPYCSAPGLYGHVVSGSTSSGDTKAPAEKEAERAARAAVKKGNIDWDASEALRHKWITDLIKRRSLSKNTTNALIGHVNEALLSGTWGISEDLNKGATTENLATFLGLNTQQAQDRAGFAGHAAKDPRRAPQLQFAAIAAVREKSATRSAWRTDDQHAPWTRKPTGQWFRVLESLGYQLTPIEQSVMDGEPYDPAKKTARAAITSGSEPETEQESGAEEEPEAEEAEEAEEADEPSSDDDEAAA
ncbi:ParB N-terminal domain-containing protein [Streptomyces sp. H39-S7]|uniref:ParB N-terminal domain-containing protein n=1 Tax=Streptomyces sp. H39-S7 TaxID=3004357 RepID=UPI0022AE5A8C|nr:ParB N-terminal domain-containing protein [Streptomyces sp. H39-S7]MCZ4125993.1 ParB N-terminal domain-containing protein [Streptomyces sp. H39-S7]